MCGRSWQSGSSKFFFVYFTSLERTLHIPFFFFSLARLPLCCDFHWTINIDFHYMHAYAVFFLLSQPQPCNKSAKGFCPLEFSLFFVKLKFDMREKKTIPSLTSEFVCLCLSFLNILSLNVDYVEQEILFFPLHKHTHTCTKLLYIYTQTIAAAWLGWVWM